MPDEVKPPITPAPVTKKREGVDKWLHLAEGEPMLKARRITNAEGKLEEYPTVGTGHYLSPANKAKLEGIWGKDRYAAITGGGNITPDENKAAYQHHLATVVPKQLDSWNPNWRKLNPMLQQWLKLHVYSMGGNIGQFNQTSNALNAMVYNPTQANSQRLWDGLWNSRFRRQTGTRMKKLEPLFQAGSRRALQKTQADEKAEGTGSFITYDELRAASKRYCDKHGYADADEALQDIYAKQEKNFKQAVKLASICKGAYDKSKQWIGVDLDGTLAQQGEWKGVDQIGAPIMRMLTRVKGWLDAGKNVKIFTARVANDPDGKAEKAIKAWCKKHVGQTLPVTNAKDMYCTRIWDNIAVGVKKNDGAQKKQTTPQGINVDVKVGDTVMVGRFKNKKVKVEEIGKDENGLPTINGRKMLTMRVEKLMKAARLVTIYKAAAEKVKKGIAKGQTIETDPSEAQKESENYKKGHVNLDGLQISIENPVGSYRSGTSDDGKEWEQKIHDDYGYIKGSKGYDKDHLDVFINPGYPEDALHYAESVYVVNQVWNGKFDEHKCMIGYVNKTDAKKGYMRNYEDGWQGCGSIVEMDFDKFKEWAMGTGPSKGSLRQSKDMTLPPVDKTAAVSGRCLQNDIKEANYPDKTIHEGIEGMQKKSVADTDGGIDPAWFTTPAGALGGAFLVHALSKNPNWKKDVAGAAAGGALGYGAARLPDWLDEVSDAAPDSIDIAGPRPDVASSIMAAPPDVRASMRNASNQYRRLRQTTEDIAGDPTLRRMLHPESLESFTSTPSLPPVSVFADALRQAQKDDPNINEEDFIRRYIHKGRGGEATQGTVRALRDALMTQGRYTTHAPLIESSDAPMSGAEREVNVKRLALLQKRLEGVLGHTGQQPAQEQRMGKATSKWDAIRRALASPGLEKLPILPSSGKLRDYVSKRRAEGVSTANAVLEFARKHADPLMQDVGQHRLTPVARDTVRRSNSLLKQLLKDPLN